MLRDDVVRVLTDVPVAGHPTRLHMRLPRYRCAGAQCEQRVVQQRLDCAQVGAKTTNRCMKWILQRVAIDKMSISAVARALGWDLVNSLAAVRSLVDDDPTRLQGVWTLSQRRSPLVTGEIHLLVSGPGKRPDSKGALRRVPWLGESAADILAEFCSVR